MFAVVFDVDPRDGQVDEYLALAGMLRPELEGIEGFLSVERFTSRRRPGWMLSLSFWRDEAAVARWRAHALHHDVQERARSEVFRNYRLRVGRVVADDAPGQAQPGPGRRTTHDDPALHPPACVGILEVGPVADVPGQRPGFAALHEVATEPIDGFLGGDWFDSIYVEGKRAQVTSWRDQAAALAWHDRALAIVAAPLAMGTSTYTAPAGGAGAAFRLRVMEVGRDYGMFERAEAPQYHAPIARVEEEETGAAPRE